MSLTNQLSAQSQDDFVILQNPDNTLSITGYRGSLTEIVIPGTIHGLRVTAIGDFSGKGLTSVVIPNTITSIGDFSNNSLTSVVIPNSVTSIGNRAFFNNPITSLTLGNSVGYIGERAFSGGTLSRDLRTVTGNFALQLSELHIPNSVTAIGESAFASIGTTRGALSRVTFGNRLEWIGDDAFRNNQISELNLPASLRTIRLGAFRNNQIHTLVIPNGVTLIAGEIAPRDAYEQRIASSPFAGNPITDLVIPASLAARSTREERGGGASIITITTAGIDNGVFSGMNIPLITLPANMNEAALRANFEAAFINFWISQNRAAGSYIKRGQIWTRASAAEANQFRNELQAARREAEAAETARREAEAAAQREAQAAQAARQQQTAEARQAALTEALNRLGFTGIFRSDGTVEITGYTGRDRRVSIPERISWTGNNVTVTRIGDNAFRQRIAAGDITDITIPNSVSEIGERAFANYNDNGSAGRSRLATLSWGSGLRNIGSQAFAGNSNLTRVVPGTRPDQTTVSDNAFDTRSANETSQFLQAWNNRQGLRGHLEFRRGNWEAR